MFGFKKKGQQHLKPRGDEFLLVFGEVSDQDIIAARNVFGEGERRSEINDRAYYWQHVADPQIGRLSTEQFALFKQELDKSKKLHYDNGGLTSDWGFFAGRRHMTCWLEEQMDLQLGGGVYYIVMTPETAAMALEPLAGEYSHMMFPFMLRSIGRSMYYAGAAIVSEGTATFTGLRDES